MVQVAGSIDLDDNHRGHQSFFHQTAAQYTRNRQHTGGRMQKLSSGYF